MCCFCCYKSNYNHRQKWTNANYAKWITAKKSSFIAITGRRHVGKIVIVRKIYEEQVCFSVTGIQNASLSVQIWNVAVSLVLIPDKLSGHASPPTRQSESEVRRGGESGETEWEHKQNESEKRRAENQSESGESEWEHKQNESEKRRAEKQSKSGETEWERRNRAERSEIQRKSTTAKEKTHTNFNFFSD